MSDHESESMSTISYILDFVYYSDNTHLAAPADNSDPFLAGTATELSLSLTPRIASSANCCKSRSDVSMNASCIFGLALLTT